MRIFVHLVVVTAREDDTKIDTISILDKGKTFGVSAQKQPPAVRMTQK